MLLSHEIGSPKRQNTGSPGGLRPLDPLPGRCPAPAGDLGGPQTPRLFYAPLSKKLDQPLRTPMVYNVNDWVEVALWCGVE
jgi:hypothetical protein